MNKTFDSIATDTADIALNMMTIEELRAVISTATNKINEVAEHHRIIIEQAIMDAIKDGFDVSFWVEGTKDCCMMFHDEPERIKHIRVN